MVSCYSEHSADIYDFITLRTDNPNKSNLTIRVYAFFQKAEPMEKSDLRTHVNDE